MAPLAYNWIMIIVIIIVTGFIICMFYLRILFVINIIISFIIVSIYYSR